MNITNLKMHPLFFLLSLSFSQASDMCSVGTSPIKLGQEEQSLTPPGKTPAVGTRSPNCGRQQHAARAKTLPNTAGTGTNPKQECEGFQSFGAFEMFSQFSDSSHLVFKCQKISLHSVGPARIIGKPVTVIWTLDKDTVTC